MAVWLLKMFGISLILTVFIELAVVSLFFGVRSKKEWLLVLLVNVLTNPPAVLLHWLGSIDLPVLPDLWLQILIEITVVITETLIYHSFTQKESWRIRKPVLMSLTANLCSWLTGIFIQAL